MENDTTAKIRGFVRPDLRVLQDDLHAKGMKRPSKDDVASALIYAARRSPVEGIKGLLEAYFAAERDAYPPSDEKESTSD
jgi:hypothetical protein